MAILARPKDNEDYARLVGMTQPSATPSKRIGTDAPVGSFAAGPAAGKSASEFTQSTKSSPGNVFARQLGGANIEGITSLAEKPLGREAAAEALRVAGEGTTYKTDQETNLAKQPQFNDFSAAAGGVASGDETTTATGQAILNRNTIPVPKLEIGDIKEFTPNQALRGGSVESLLRGEATGPYTSGMAGLDALLFQKKGGAAQLGQRGIALRAAGQATADALEKSATAEAEKNAADLVSGQKSGFMSALSGALDPRLAGYQAGIDPITQGRQAAAGQATQAMIQNALVNAGLLRTKVAGELIPKGENFNGTEVIPVDAGGQYIDSAGVDTALAGVNIEDIINRAVVSPTVQGATIADVAAQDPQNQAEYQRLLDMLGLGGGDVSKYKLGNTTSPVTTGPSMMDQNQLNNLILDALRKAGGSVPKISVPQNPSGNTNTLNPYDAARARAERGGY
jgi:hypothetical protein